MRSGRLFFYDRNWRELSLRGLGILGADMVSVVRINRKISDVRAHTHPGIVELIYCMRGEKLKCLRNGVVDVLSPGEMFVAFPSERHCVLDGPKGRFTYMLQFKLPRAGEKLFGMTAAESRLLVRQLKRSRRVFSCPSEMPSLFQSVLRVCDDRTIPVWERRLRVRRSLDSILLLACDAAVKGVRATKAYDAGIAAIIEEIRKNPCGDYPLDQLCGRLGMSKPSFIMRFKLSTGSTPHAYLLKCRVDSGKRMLASGRNVTSVAHELGFASVQHFTKTFRDVTGAPPSCRKKVVGS